MFGSGSGRVVWCYVCVSCDSGLVVKMAGPGICILCILVHSVFNPVAPYRYRFPTVCLHVTYIANYDLFVCGCCSVYTNNMNTRNVP